MKNLYLLVLVFALNSIGVFAQCETEPMIAAGKTLRKLKISNQSATEYLLKLKASATGASWQKAQAEAAVLTVFVDDKYNQDIILFAGEETFEYQALLGNLSTGKHEISIIINEARSAPLVKQVKIQTVSAVPSANPANDSKHLATINAPFIYLRPDTIDKFSDIPLLTYYEVFDEPENVKRIRYTTIFTNEDGGTASAALMARWGRMTDIEWIYEIRVAPNGGILSEIYQGANHVTKNFQGKRFSSHPIIFDATVNNNFADTGCSALRVSPLLVAANLTNGSRETVMDKFSWTYQIMAQEAIREGRVNPANLSVNTIADLRDYWYLEIRSEPEKAAVSVEIENGQEKSLSDFGDQRLRVERPGFFRIAVRKPTGLTKDFPDSVNLVCSQIAGQPKGFCRNLQLVKIVRLDRLFLPHEKMLTAQPQNIGTGQKISFKIE